MRAVGGGDRSGVARGNTLAQAGALEPTQRLEATLRLLSIVRKPLGARSRAGWMTPVPGGVGPLTIAMLLKNTLRAAQRSAGIDPHDP